MIKPTRNTGVHMTTTLTPFEQSHNRAATLGVRLVESLAVNRLVAQAHAYEHDMAKIGNGCPPLSETLIINTMWNQVGMFAEFEA
jgi:hypothetical protein